MTKLPKKVSIGGHNWKVVVTDEIGDYGLCEFGRKTIYINKGYPLECQYSTLLHEVLHAILYQGGVSQFLSTKMEEAIVHCLESGIFPLYKLKIGDNHE